VGKKTANERWGKGRMNVKSTKWKNENAIHQIQGSKKKNRAAAAVERGDRSKRTFNQYDKKGKQGKRPADTKSGGKTTCMCGLRAESLI